mgnify:CR=1 FL=1
MDAEHRLQCRGVVVVGGLVALATLVALDFLDPLLHSIQAASLEEGDGGEQGDPHSNEAIQAAAGATERANEGGVECADGPPHDQEDGQDHVGHATVLLQGLNVGEHQDDDGNNHRDDGQGNGVTLRTGAAGGTGGRDEGASQKTGSNEDNKRGDSAEQGKLGRAALGLALDGGFHGGNFVGEGTASESTTEGKTSPASNPAIFEVSELAESAGKSDGKPDNKQDDGDDGSSFDGRVFCAFFEDDHHNGHDDADETAREDPVSQTGVEQSKCASGHPKVEDGGHEDNDGGDQDAHKESVAVHGVKGVLSVLDGILDVATFLALNGLGLGLVDRLVLNLDLNVVVCHCAVECAE